MAKIPSNFLTHNSLKLFKVVFQSAVLSSIQTLVGVFFSSKYKIAIRKRYKIVIYLTWNDFSSIILKTSSFPIFSA